MKCTYVAIGIRELIRMCAHKPIQLKLNNCLVALHKARYCKNCWLGISKRRLIGYIALTVWADNWLLVTRFTQNKMDSRKYLLIDGVHKVHHALIYSICSDSNVRLVEYRVRYLGRVKVRRNTKYISFYNLNSKDKYIRLHKLSTNSKVIIFQQFQWY